MTRRATTWLAALAIVILGAAAYSDSFRGVFVMDDNNELVLKTTTHQLWPLTPILKSPRPVADLTFAVNYAIGGGDVTGYHLVNLAVHIFAALTLFGIVRRTLSLPRLAGQFGSAASPPAPQQSASLHATGLALAVALLWMLHPLQTESVTYVVQRAESLMGLFYLLTLYCAIRAFTTAGAKELRMANGQWPIANSQFPIRNSPFAIAFSRRFWPIAAVLACALGVGVKPVIVSAPLVVLAYDRLFLAGSLKAALRRSWRLYLGLAATWLILAFLLLRNPPIRGASAGFGMENLTPWMYARTQFGVIVHYLALCFRPWPLCLDYGWPVAWNVRDILPPALLVLALLGATLAALRRASPLAFLGAWFFLILAPTSSVMPIHDLCVEHRMYLPLAAVVALVVVGAYALGRRALELAIPADRLDSRRRLGIELAAITCLLAAGFLGGLTYLRNQLYENEAAIWKDAALHRPHNARAFAAAGVALVNQDRWEEAVPYLEHALDIQQGNPAAHEEMGLTLTETGRGAAQNELGIALSRLGRYDEAARHFTAGLAAFPDDALAQFSFGNTLVAVGQAPEAVVHYRKAIELQPHFAAAHYALANALADQGRNDEAIAEYEATLALSPSNGRAHNNLGRLLARLGRSAEAVAHYNEALRLLPAEQKFVAQGNLAWLRATCPDSKFRDAEEALRLARAQAIPRSETQNGSVVASARALDVLAAACAEAGLFDEAVAAARQAVAAAEQSGEKASAAEIRERLRLYEAHRPYRERWKTTKTEN